MERHLNFNHLHYFHVVASEGSLAAAARRLGVTQPTISGQLKQLEAALGGPLFDRSPGNELRMNERGRRVFEHTTVMFSAGVRLMDELSNGLGNGARLLEIGVASAVSKTFIARFFMPLFALDHVHPRIRVSDHEHLLRQLASLELDFVLTDTVPTASTGRTFEHRIVHSARMLAVASPRMAPQLGAFQEGATGFPLIQYGASSRARQEIDAHFRRHGLTPRTIGEVDDVGVMIRAALDGIAVAIVPETAAEDHLNRGALVVLSEIESMASVVSAIYNQGSTAPRVLEAITLLTQANVGRIAA